MAIGPGGADSPAEMEAAIDASYVVSPTAGRAGLAIAGTGVLVAILSALAAVIPLVVVSAVMVVVGAVLWGKERMDRRAAAEAAAAEKARRTREAGQIAEALREHRSRYETLATSAKEDRDAILTIVS